MAIPLTVPQRTERVIAADLDISILATCRYPSPLSNRLARDTIHYVGRADRVLLSLWLRRTHPPRQRTATTHAGVGGRDPSRGRNHTRRIARQSRSGQIVDRLEEMGIGVLFVVGGDGTFRGAITLVAEIARRGLSIGVIGLPKTIDNDIHFIDRSFGFESAFSAAVDVIRSAHVEAKGAKNGVGVVKLMGRHSGFIACHASIASTDVDAVLITEDRLELEGENGLLSYLSRRLREDSHALVVVAEGAGQELCSDEDRPSGVDASGNVRLKDIGMQLKDRISSYFAERASRPPAGGRGRVFENIYRVVRPIVEDATAWSMRGVLQTGVTTLTIVTRPLSLCATGRARSIQGAICRGLARDGHHRACEGVVRRSSEMSTIASFGAWVQVVPRHFTECAAFTDAGPVEAVGFFGRAPNECNILSRL
jgi:hypothetical protein